VRSYIADLGKIDPAADHARLADQRQKLEQRCRCQLKNPLKRRIFDRLLARSQGGSVFRENVKSEVIKLLVAIRKMIIELGKRLADKGVLESPDDIFFLRLEETQAVASGNADFDVQQAIAARRTEYEKNRLITPPDVVFGRFNPDTYVPEPVDENAEVLNGLAVSPGVATGKARVILRADTDQQVLAREVLVAPFTDPGWTPYFVPAAAVVMDQGGLLSHGSIVAREYGIPAVVNVGNATKIIKTGQTINVDANNGVVRRILTPDNKTAPAPSQHAKEPVAKAAAKPARRAAAVPQPIKSWQDRQVWTNLNVGEVVPDVVTPVTWSMVQLLLDHMFEPICRLISVNLGDNPLYGLIAGRLYYNINTGIGLFKNFLPRLQHYDYDLNKLFGGEQGRMYDLGRLDIQDADVPDLQFSRLKTILKSPVSFYRILSHNLKKGELFVADMRSKNERLLSLDIAAMSEEQLLVHSGDLTADGIEIARGLAYIATGLIAFLCLHKVCGKWLGDKDGTIANKLLAGVGDMDSAEAGHDLWRLAKKADERPDVRALIVSGKSWKTVRQKLCETNPGNEFLKSWDEFMIQHGHHCRGEMELFNPRWSESPDYILSLVGEYLAGIDKSNPVENHTKRAQQRQQLTGKCRQRLKNPIRRFIFNYLLDRAQRGCVLRENWKSQGVRYIARFRRILIELGERLYTRDNLASPADFFFLKLEEIEPVTRNRANFDVNKAIGSRRAQYERNKGLTPPPVVVGRFAPDDYAPEVLETDVDVLKGLAVSAGVVKGKARVILRADTDQQVMPGEILVAPFTDPGWTPYFVPAAAIVMDQGGLLSHGSIIAREYGIPAVVNVGPGTKIIKTGQTIQVDGNEGVVTIVG
jgi:phosphohistidine swiveling domain-containing protein